MTDKAKLVTKTLKSALIIAGIPAFQGMIRVMGVGATRKEAMEKAAQFLAEKDKDRRSDYEQERVRRKAIKEAAVEHACKVLKSEGKPGRKKVS